ncbi:hypothetical protein QOZ80_6AG0527510 [Eleusine coracana subsp. coracana]|nr:hypothetical protein QOZ80_6AG0527510 [Eleusine coracana subsp. coracana]
MAEAKPTMVFVYGTLKRGFPNHPLLAASASPLSLYAPSPSALAELDALEGTHIGLYERRRLTVVVDGSNEMVEAEGYFAHPSYAEALWRRCGGEAAEIGEYTVDHAARYVPPSGRSPGASALIDAIYGFIDTAQDN